MKLKNILPILALGTLAFQACDDNKMDWYNPHEGNGVTNSQLPLPLAEKISRYDVLKSYIPRADFQIGLGMGMESYMGSENYRAIVDANFNSVTLGNAMKQSSVMNAKGETDFSKVDAFLKVLPQDMALYGHNLIWHTQQAASYLNGLIAPEVIPAPAGENQLPNGSFEEGMEGWGSWGESKGSVEVTDEQSLDGDKSLKVVINSSGGTVYSMQLQSPNITFVTGNRYQVSFYIKSDVPGAVRMSFDSGSVSLGGSAWPSNNASDGQDNTISTSTTWKQVVYDETTSTSDFVARLTSGNFRLDLGMLPDVTYYIDNVVVVDLDAAPAVVNLLSNGTFDSDLTGWGKWNGPDNCLTHATGTDAYQGGGAMKVSHDIGAEGSQWKVQIHSDFTETLTVGKKYEISYMIRSEAAGSVRCSTTGEDEHYQPDQATSTVWKKITWEISSNGKEAGLNFDLGGVSGTYYIDDVVVQEVAAANPVINRAGPIIIEKTDEEKDALISAAMEKWIKEMAGHYKGRVKAWDVLNEPIDDGGKLRGVEIMPNESDMDGDDFYYGKYMGKIYGAKAFMWAREADPTAKLFINDYNLEYSKNKRDRLIEYVQYIDQNGGQVDGIGTQMHIAIDTNKGQIVEMFQDLAKTGKLIRITEMDIKVNTSSPTADNLAAQAEMYQYVIDMYKQHIPEAQQDGITIWTLSDHPDEHVYWIPNDAPNLFDANYARKHAYKGVCDGLAGRDVSIDFPGDLQ